VWFLPKPYDPSQLAHLVRECLESSEPSINPAVPVKSPASCLVGA
jgi:hypothetical protein